MKVFDVMKSNAFTLKKENTILDVMKMMKEKDIGFVIIEENNEAIGIITDRDIVLSLAKEISVNTAIAKIMKKYVITIKETDDVTTASDMMGYMQVRRLVVTNDDNKITGVISITDLLRHSLTEESALEAMIEISYNYSTKDESNDILLQTKAFIF